jgi:2'-hydroxyisoflavone reductase
MKLLVLGGTLFLGRHVVAAALRCGHRVTTFTRGRTNPRLFPEAEALHGDRDGDLGALGGRTWDAVVDTSAYVPRQAAAAAEALRGRIGRYCLISTGSVYAAFPAGGAREGTATQAAADDPEAACSPSMYGPLKLGCERRIVDSFDDRALVIRPGVLAGPHDPTGRLGYWVHRVATGGEVLAAGDPAHPVQLLDARDLAAWLIPLLEEGGAGVFNASGPPALLTMARLLETCRMVAASDARLTWVDDAFLLEQGVTPWSDVPLWLPADVPSPMLDSRRAQAAGLRCRPLSDTVRDVLADDVNIQRVAGGPPRPEAISGDRERELLRLWHTQLGPASAADAAPAHRTT